MTSRVVVNQTNSNNTSDANVREVSHVTVVTGIQPTPDSV